MLSANLIKRFLPSRYYETLRKKYLSILSSKLVQNVNLLNNVFYDYRRYLKHYSTLSSVRTQKQHEAKIIFLYHKLEKGMALKDVKIGFGKEVAHNLVEALNTFYKKYGWNDICQAAANCLYAYYSFNKEHQYVDEDLRNKLKFFKSEKRDTYEGGTKKIYKKDIYDKLFDFKSFAQARYSIRNFTDEEVSLDLIEEAVSIAQKTPSVCNRQTSRVYVYDGDKKNEVLKYQNGNSGFGENANKILLVTSDLQYFVGSDERFQAYIDGGMFAMSLIYALHSLGLGTCPLNLAIGKHVDKKLRKAAQISDSEVMIMMIAVGHIPNELNVASSYRRDAQKVIKVYK